VDHNISKEAVPRMGGIPYTQVVEMNP
jgi:hypothetical protein